MATNITEHPFRNCHAVSPTCPVEATTLGYYPNAGINYFFAIGFGVSFVALLALGLPKRVYGYSCFVAAGAALELAGYAARVPLHANPWDQQAFETQICAIILAPTLLCIGIYLTLQHVCLALSPALSRVRPTLYPWLFVPADVSCLLVQAAGGALAASAGYTNTTLLNAGNHLIIAGIALQVAVLALFGAAALDYYVRVRRWLHDDGVATAEHAAAVALWRDRRFRLYGRAVALAYVCILIRCIYRIAEMAGGWGNYIMQDEPSFIVLEGFMVLIAVALLAAFPPGYLFPQMARPRKNKNSSTVDDRADDTAAAPAPTGDAEKDTEAGTAVTPTGTGEDQRKGLSR